MVTVIGLKKCDCGYKEPYGCLRYYTVGAPFTCPKCNKEMDNAPFWIIKTTTRKNEATFRKLWKYFRKNIDKIDYEVVVDQDGLIEIHWVGVEKFNGI